MKTAHLKWTGLAILKGSFGIAIVIRLMGCVPEDGVAPAEVAGCYGSEIGPFLEQELREPEKLPRWIMLDSVRYEGAPIDPAYRLRMPPEYEHPSAFFSGLWEPVGRDSIAVHWDSDGWSRELRLAVSPDGLEGIAIPRLDIDVPPADTPSVVATRRRPCDDG